MLQSAIELEFSTIPVYLCGLWTIQSDPDSVVTQILTNIVVTEMRHLAIAANVMIATGGTPDITAAVPAYPAFLPDGETVFKVDLLPFGQAFLEQATWIESPTPVTSVSPVNFGRESPFAPRFVRAQPTLAMGEMFGTIGEFYTALIQTLNNLVTDLGEPAVFPNSANVAAQYNGIDFLGFPDFSGSSTLVVANSTEAVTLLQDIIDEGEGTSPGIMWDETGTLLSHYYSFQEILLERQYVAGDTPGSPSGPAIAVPTGSQVLAMVENPTMDMYPAESDVWNAANSFNTAFGELVTSLQQAFSGTNTNPGAIIKSAIELMNSLQTEGLAVLAFPLPGNAAVAVAGPTFNNGFVPLTPCQQATIAVEQASTFVRDAQIAVDIARMGDNTAEGKLEYEVALRQLANAEKTLASAELAQQKACAE
jgi:Ferritin-like